MYGISRIVVSKYKNTVLTQLSTIYFITQGRGAQIFVCYVRPEVNMKKGLGEEDVGEKGVLLSTGDALGSHYVFSSFFLPNLWPG